MTMRSLIFIILCVPVVAHGQTVEAPHAIDTQAPGEHPPSPLEATRKISLPEGFTATLFAGDPFVHQPIAFEIDDRGRLWVVECYTYEGGKYDLQKRDRILILSDTDGDGRFDSRKVFWDQGQRLTGIELGFGGVWLTSAPHLLFLPDANSDDVPDAEPQIILDGFSIQARHNMVNGLRWGPDGWLYGRHGITDTSRVGTAQTPVGKRVSMNCSIWRYHPQRHIFEVVTNGTTNPWGLDYDDHGQWFFTNNVINHLWHVVPGAHYQRMFGDDFNPHLYQLITPTADHYHWDTLGEPGESGNKNRKKYDGRHDEHGGGHSHAGGMIYLGGAWPKKYRNALFMCNTHGRRVNMDRLARRGTGYVGKHGKDFLFANDDWFRGVELKYGPDGNVYLTDWSDLGECHDSDGVHRSSGRIYKIAYGVAAKPTRNVAVDIAAMNPNQLVDMQLHENDWFVRHARRRLHELAAANHDLSSQIAALQRIFTKHPDATRKLRAMWALHCINATPVHWLVEQLQHPNEHVRTWATRLLTDRGDLSDSAVASLAEAAKHESSGLVRLFLASAMQRIDHTKRWDLALPLSQCTADANDQVQPLMIWYGIEPAVMESPDDALSVAKSTVFPLLRRHIARRIGSEIEEHPEASTQLLELARRSPAPHAADYLQGMSEAFRGQRKVQSQEDWQAILQAFAESPDAELSRLAREISVVMGDGRSIQLLIDIAKDRQADPTSRREALQVVLETRPAGFAKTLLAMRADRVVGADAIRGLAFYESPMVPAQLMKMLPNAKHDHRPAIIEAMASRPTYAAVLLDALAKGDIGNDDISPVTASKIANLDNDQLRSMLEKHWGSVKTTSAEKEQLIERYRTKLTADDLAQGNLPNGRRLFAKVCGNCHKMFGAGKEIGPDLTGSNRDNLDYLFDNIIDPSRVVPIAMRQSLFVLKDGRVIAGVPISENDQTVTLQSVDEQIRLPRDEIDERKPQQTSLMPEGLLSQLSEVEIRDLFAYLQSSAQVSASD